MSDTSDNIIVDTATRIFQDLCEPATSNDAEKGVGHAGGMRRDRGRPSPGFG
jgi:hypothetical protein